MEKKPLLVDISIPYCIREERYQNRFQLIGSNEEKNAYLAAVKRELQSYAGSLDEYEVQGLHLSGGNATVMSPDLLGDLLRTAREILPVARGAEFTVDAHPFTIGTPALTGIASGHPNRFELMMRSGNEEELKALGCVHTMQHTNNAVLFFGRFHVNNFGLTVNLGIPGQTESSWHNTIHACTILHPAHISLCPLDVKNADGMPDMEMQERMYQHAGEYLTENGYLQYTSRHFCLPQHASRCAILETETADRIGLGLGAFTQLDGYLTRNTNNLKIYLTCAGNYEKTTAQVFRLDHDYLVQQYVHARCSCVQGLNPVRFRERFQENLSDSICRKLDDMLQNGLLTCKEGIYQPTEKGLYQAL